ncbi:hypothetical protein [Ohtaekwangia sp.]|uniref:hypothetical protein n=1 Tax=Ohtaekwangia sp. TaxID=2066019 RepID=UPI002F94DEB2
MSNFRLVKWYLDASDNEHQAFIGYAATLAWKWIKLHYSGYTFLDSHGKLRKRNRFSTKAFPDTDSNTIRWKAFDCAGTWQSSDPPIEEALLDNGDGKAIRWQCILPQGDATVRIGKGGIYSGRGYAEKIELTIAPWKLPIDELHWGRFLAEGHTIIWIRWIGAAPKALVYYNGQSIAAPGIAQDKIVFDRYILQLSDAHTLRKGTVTTTVFARFPALAKLFPKSILQLQENKWLSAGTLYRGKHVMATGQAIHEIVQWK